MSMTWTYGGATIEVEASGRGRRRVTVTPSAGDAYIARTSFDTSYPDDLIREILAVKGPAWLCDELARDEDPSYVELNLRNDLLSFVPPGQFSGQRILDFGCGSGASTVILARMFPDAEIVGVELEPEFVDLAQKRLTHHGISNATVRLSPGPMDLPADVGEFGSVILSAVWEHLLPEERPVILRLLWSVLQVGGVLFIDQTPHRWSPVERHTTGLPLINYLPASAAHAATTRLSRRLEHPDTWPELLRKGIRGGTVGEILEDLPAGSRATLLDPLDPGVDGVDIWYSNSTTSSVGDPIERRPTSPKWLARGVLKTVKRLTGVVAVPTVTIAIRKDADHPRQP